MKLFKYAKFIGLLTGAVALLTACEKTDEIDPLGDGGVNIVKIMEGGTFEEPGTPLGGVNFINATQTTPILTVRRDVTSEAEMNKSQTVTVKLDTALMRIYNDTLISHGDDPYLTMPASWYTTNPTYTQGGTFDLTFAPGELAKSVYITIPNASLFDPAAVYGFPYTIVSASPDQKISASKSVISLLGAKNQYDGVYSVVSGFVQRYTAPGVPDVGATTAILSGPLGPANADITLGTTGAQTLDFYPNGPSAVGITWANNSGVGGVAGLNMTVDPFTNEVTMKSVESTSLANFPGAVNKYDPATKTFTLKFRWNPTANTREYTVVLKYKAAR